jgi:hypothetical protein
MGGVGGLGWGVVVVVVGRGDYLVGGGGFGFVRVFFFKNRILIIMTKSVVLW